jgi:hypothetical protein
MATVNKDFKIKSGLIVEGTTGTINGYNILTESQDSQDFIIDIIGGETLITSVESTQLEVVSGELNVKSGVFDAYGDAAAAETAANLYTDGRETAITSAYQTYADDAADAAETAANSYTDGRETAITSAYESYADTAEQDAKNYADGLAVNYDAAGAAATAEQNAKDYADDLINDASSSSTEVWSAYKTSTEIGLAQAAAEGYADNAVAALVDAAPAMLDTLNELAAALGDDEDFIGTVNAAIGEKVAKAGDTMTGALTLSGAPTSANHAATKDYVDGKASDAYNDAIATAADDATSKANTAEQNAKNYADDLTTSDIAEGTNLYFTNQRAIDAVGGTIGDAINELTTDDIEEGLTNQYFTDSRAKTSAADLLTGATLTNITISGNGSGLTITAENGVADSDTDDLGEGSTNLYFTNARAQDALEGTTPTFAAVNLDEVAKHVAGTTVVPVAGIATAYSWLKADYRSAEFLVKVAYGTHTEISKVLLTLDTSDNISVTEYGIVGTNGSGSSSVSAAISGNDVQLKVTTLNNTSTVTVVGTLLA